MARYFNPIIFSGVLILSGLILYQCTTLKKAPEVQDNRFYEFTTNPEGEGIALLVEFRKGEAHNHPLMAVWIEDTSGNYIQTLYVAESIATGTFQYGKVNKGMWMPGEIRRPAALPYWAHKRGVRESDGLYMPTRQTAIPDAYTGATPKENFLLNTRTDQYPPEPFRLLFEINQSWDWNEYWTNNKYPDDREYKSSAQPSLVYATTIDLRNERNEYILNPIGHGHHAGQSGELFEDISTLTTAMQIATQIRVTIKR